MAYYSFYDRESYQKSWRPVSIADANRPGISWTRRTEAEDLLDGLTFKYQQAAASCALGRNVKISELKSKAQRAPMFTQYPDYPAARASLGFSALMEYTAQQEAVKGWLKTSLDNIGLSESRLDPGSLNQVKSFIIEAVNNRTAIDHLVHFEGIIPVDSYRFFAAAIIDPRFVKLKDIIFAACILGDLILGILNRHKLSSRIHPLTLRILAALAPVIEQYERSLENCSSPDLPEHAMVLAAGVLRALLPFLPLKQIHPETPPETIPPQIPQPPSDPRRVNISRPWEPPEDVESLPLNGTDEVRPPEIQEKSGTQSMYPKQSGKQDHDNRMKQPEELSQQQQQIQKIMQTANAALNQATSSSNFDGPRVDQVSDTIRRNLFRPGVAEANLKTPKQLVKAYGSDEMRAISEEVLKRCRNKEDLNRVRRGAKPVEKKIRKFRWFGKRTQMCMSRYQRSGGLDPRRSHKIGSSNLLFRRWEKHELSDYKKWPVVVLAKDGSSSNTLETTFAGQIVVSAFLQVERLARIRLVAADYSSGSGGTCVKWLYHPHKTPGLNPFQAADAVASLPSKGQGSNHDTVSVSFIMRETFKAFDTNQPVILINISDGKFNSPIDKVRKMVGKLREDYDLTYSFVILGNQQIDVPEADYIISVPESELTNPQAIAATIAKHINEMVLNRRRKGNWRKNV